MTEFNKLFYKYNVKQLLNITPVLINDCWHKKTFNVHTQTVTYSTSQSELLPVMCNCHQELLDNNTQQTDVVVHYE